MFENLIYKHWEPLHCWFSVTVPNSAQKCWWTLKLWPKIISQNGGRPPSWSFGNLISDHWDALGYWFSITDVDRRKNYGRKSKSNLGFSKILFLSTGTPWAARYRSLYKICLIKCRSTPKLWPKIISQNGGRPPSWIFENLISQHWDPLGCRFSITVQNLAQ